MTDPRALPPDTILLGDVVTMDDRFSRAAAVAIAGERIVAVGARSDVLARRGPDTVVRDFGRSAIIPGFNDAHAHMDTEGMKLIRPTLDGCRSIADVVDRIARIARTRAEGEWIVTMPVGTPIHYFDGPKVLAEGRMPDRHALDRAAPRHPVCIRPPSGYWGQPPCFMALNSLALRLNGIDRDTVSPIAGIEIEKDDAGEPTGVFIDRNPHETAELALMPAVPRYTTDERARAVVEAMRLYHSKGTTSVYEGHGCSPEVIAIYRELWETGRLSMRMGMVVAPAWADAAEAEAQMRDWLPYARGRGFGDARLRIAGVHVNLGGDAHAAVLARARGNDTGYWSHIRQANDAAAFETIAMAAARHDLRFHTIASAGTQKTILPILARGHAAHDLVGRRWVIEHLSLADEGDLQTIKELGLGVTLIPMHHLWKNGAMFFDRTPAEMDLIVPARRLAALGVAVESGTDNTPYDPLVTMKTLMRREERTTARVIGPAGRIAAPAALATVTTAGAWFTFEEDVKGRLLPGQLADCAVLSANPLDVPPEAYDTIACRATLVGGRVVWEA
ncbi:MAG: amidohydrolase family protein [Alphaproteobacteria bacterium]|nr:amidohydrolase family protein [Alphaproteobacteria bacterium]